MTAEESKTPDLIPLRESFAVGKEERKGVKRQTEARDRARGGQGGRGQRRR